MPKARVLDGSTAEQLRQVLPFVGERLFRFYLCGGARQLSRWFLDDVGLRTIQAAERFADKLPQLPEDYRIGMEIEAETWDYNFTPEFLDQYWELSCYQRMFELKAVERLTDGTWFVDEILKERIRWAARKAEQALIDRYPPEYLNYACVEDPEWQAKSLYKCIFGNHPMTELIDFSHVPPSLITLARRIYDESDFASLPKLGLLLDNNYYVPDALIAHLCEDRFHVKGCWALDVLLGKREIFAPE